MLVLGKFVRALQPVFKLHTRNTIRYTLLWFYLIYFYLPYSIQRRGNIWYPLVLSFRQDIVENYEEENIGSTWAPITGNNLTGSVSFFHWPFFFWGSLFLHLHVRSFNIALWNIYQIIVHKTIFMDIYTQMCNVFWRSFNASDCCKHFTLISNCHM